MTLLPVTSRSGGWKERGLTGLWHYFALLLLLALRLASGETALLAYAGLGAYALLGHAPAVRALALSFLFTMVNPGLAPEAASAAGRFVVLIGAAASALIHGPLLAGVDRVRMFVLFTMVVGLIVVVHSLFVSRVPDVSVLKAISWTVATATLLSCWCAMSAQQRDQTAEQLFWGLVLLLLASLPLLAAPVGYLRNGWAFQGVLNHPQLFGPVMALLGAWAAARLIAERNPSWIMMGLTVAATAMVLLSAARTAGLAMAGGVGLAVALAPMLSGRPVRSLFQGLRSMKVRLGISATLVGALLMAPVLTERISEFIAKNSAGSSFFEIYAESRGVLFEPMLDNIAENPWTGIGFGIASHVEQMVVQRDPVLGVPTSAPVEKGLTALAVVEELGYPLAMVVLWWFLVLVRGCARGGLVPLAACMTILLFNFGEATLFSPGGSGMLWLILLTWAYAQGRTASTHA